MLRPHHREVKIYGEGWWPHESEMRRKRIYNLQTYHGCFLTYLMLLYIFFYCVMDSLQGYKLQKHVILYLWPSWKSISSLGDMIHLRHIIVCGYEFVHFREKKLTCAEDDYNILTCIVQGKTAREFSYLCLACLSNTYLLSFFAKMTSLMGSKISRKWPGHAWFTSQMNTKWAPVPYEPTVSSCTCMYVCMYACLCVCVYMFVCTWKITAGTWNYFMLLNITLIIVFSHIHICSEYP